MYVNERTVDIGGDGEAGLYRFYEEAFKAGLLPEIPKVDLV